MEVIRYSPNEWYQLAENAHRAVFNEIREAWLDRISYALLVVNHGSVVGYTTCREIDAFNVYWQYGGVPEHKRGIEAVRGFQAIYEFCAAKYDRITTLVRNDNVGYLHLLMKHGFLICGIRFVDNEIYVELARDTDRVITEQGV